MRQAGQALALYSWLTAVCAGLLMATLGLSPTAISCPCLAQVLAPEQPRLHVRSVEAPPLLDAAGSASPRPRRVRAACLSTPAKRPCTCSSPVAPSAPDRSCPPGRPATTLSSSSASCQGTQSGLSLKALGRPPCRTAGSSRFLGPSCAGAGPSPPPSWSSCSVLWVLTTQCLTRWPPLLREVRWVPCCAAQLTGSQTPCPG